MKILIFGASGTFGTAMERLCIAKGHDALSPSSKDVDITDKPSVEKVFRAFKPSLVVNCVALIGAPCEQIPEHAFGVNTIAVRTMAYLCAELDATLIQPSSHAVFNGYKDQPYTEDDTPDPRNIYAISKYGAECIAGQYAPKHYIVRFPTLFGSRRNNSLGFSDKVYIQIKSGKKLHIATDKIDSPTYTNDAAEKIMSLVENKSDYGVYHIANSGTVSYYDFVCKMANIMGYPTSNIVPALDKDFPSPAFKPLKTGLATIKTTHMRSWEEALEDYIK